MPLNADRLVMKTAKDMAAELFEVYALDNATYRAMRAKGAISEKRARQQFVNRLAPKLLEDARKTLTSMLAMSDDQVTPTMKEEIYEALLRDNILRDHRLVAKERAVVPKHLH